MASSAAARQSGAEYADSAKGAVWANNDSLWGPPLHTCVYTATISAVGNTIRSGAVTVNSATTLSNSTGGSSACKH